ncbi:MAG: hypothetical protein NDI84_10625 [Steroidobacteraceae bacterium]|nr:hypothetical protein [Steroidobacteraceae bacterium]
MARLAPRIGVAALLAPTAAWSQDATVLAVAFGPPLLAAPFLAQYLRSRWLLPRNGTSASLRVLIVTGSVEWLLWLSVGYLAARVVFEEELLALGLAVAGAAAVVFTLRALGAPHRSWGFTLAMVAVFPVIFAVVMVFALVVAFAL